MVVAIRTVEQPAGAQAGESVVMEATAGFRTIGREPSLRVLVGVYGAQTLVAGALDVLLVVLALDLLETGDGGVGLLYASVGVGGLVGAMVVLSVASRGRLAGPLAVGLVLWGAPIALIGLSPHEVLAVVALGLVGIGNTLVDVSALTLLQRVVADEVLGRVFGVLESLMVATIGIGAICASALVGGLGGEGALIIAGLFLPAVALVSWPRLRALDAAAVVPTHRLEILRRVPIFGPLPAITLEHLAGALAEQPMASGEVLVRAGDAGDRFYLIERGAVDVEAETGTVRLEAGEFFGEIALLRDVPRTATVTAAEDGGLLVLERDEFLGAVTGHAASAEAADAVVATRLAGLRPGLGSL